jgi:aspartate-semialdehyde dehydrogenase
MSRLVILGGHSEVASALVDALDDRGVEAELVCATTTEHIGPGLELIDERTLVGAELIFLAFEGDVASALAAGAARLDAPLVDLVGLLPRSAPLVFPILDPGVGARVAGAGPLRVPLGLVGPVVAALSALRAFEPSAARVVTFEGAARRDRAGMEELSAQTRAVFAGQSLAPEVFPGPVAFGVATSVGDEDDPFGPDDAFRADVRAGLGDERFDLRVVRTQVPVFTGEGASVEVELGDPPGLETVVDALSAARGLRAAGIAPGTLEAVDRDDALFGRLRLEGGRLALWLSADRLRHGAAASAAQLAERLLSG